MTEYYYPEKMGGILLQGMEEILGLDTLQSVLQAALLEPLIDRASNGNSGRTFSFDVISRLQQSLETAFGPRGGRGTALRVGRASFQYSLREYGSALGLTETAFRLLPLHTKIQTGVRSLAELFNKQTDQRVRVEEQDETLFWHIERCPLCWERHAHEPVCHLAVGLLQESLYWLSGGKFFRVEETACVAKGDTSCTIRVESVPVS